MVTQSLQYAYDILGILQQRGVHSVHQQNNSFVIANRDGAPLVNLNSTEVTINGIVFNDRITPAKTSSLVNKIETDAVRSFVQDLLSKSNVSLNHLGISYYCVDLSAEVSRLKQLLGNNPLYEESSDTKSTRWLFIGNADNPNEPMFELVLNQRAKPTLSSWTPHIQIDIDTELSYDDLMIIVRKHFGNSWVKWSIDVKDWGIPLVVGRLCSINGLKVYLGIGTNKRGREWHRKQGMQQI